MEVVRPFEPWTVEFYSGKTLLETRTMEEELDEVLTEVRAFWFSLQTALDSVTVRLLQGDQVWDHEEVAAEYDRRFASDVNSWYMGAQEERAAFQKRCEEEEDTRPDATVHRIYPREGDPE
jgi:hypothetical protein